MSRFALPLGERFALAVSGGPDSMALALCARLWCEKNHHPLPQAFIVDHALREESAAEAALVRQRLQALGITAEVLLWQHEAVTSAIHSSARRARYQLLLNACRCHKITSLLFAHQREDQAETILMRFAKGSGVDGLAGMAAESVKEGIRILRPFINQSKQRLIATCDAAGISYVTDPSNKAQKFARGRLREVMPLLADEGLTIDRLVDIGIRAAETREAMDCFTDEFIAAHSHQDEWGVIYFEKSALLATPRAIALRAISRALQTIHAEFYAPTHASLSLLLDTLKNEATFSARTLNGCLVSENQKYLIFMREFSAITETLSISTGETVIWDGRWQITCAAGEGTDGATVKALGNPPHEVLDRLSPDLRHKLPQGRIRATLPALWVGSEIKCLPTNVQLIAKWRGRDPN